MARANRHYIPGCVWHITHRCHKQEFLLKYAKDRKRYLYWLFEAKKRYGLRVLNYNVTSNHIHLLVIDSGSDVIPQSIQLVAGRTAQEYNQRKKRKGAYWEDRYHATAIETDSHLHRCITYIDLNMVRSGVVKHPSEWLFSGYNEIQNPPERFRLIDQKALTELCCVEAAEHFRQNHKEWAEECLKSVNGSRDPYWSESIAVGTKEFVEETREKLGYKAQGRKTVKNDDAFALREAHAPYKGLLSPQKGRLSQENTYYWNDC